MKDNNYEIYRKKLSKDKFYSNWESEQLDNLEESLINEIYEKYLIKCEVFQRDNFKCRNIECTFPDSPLTLHHVKFKKNGGKDSERNCVTLCKTCHVGFHRAKRRILFPDDLDLPAHIRGRAFANHKEIKIDWKKVKSEMRNLRKTLKSQCGLRISWEQICMLMDFLKLPYEDGDD